MPGNYERLEPWLGRCARCLVLHLVDDSYRAPRAVCSSVPNRPGWLSYCGGRIEFITDLPEVAAAWRLGGSTAAWALYCEWHMRTTGVSPKA